MYDVTMCSWGGNKVNTVAKLDTRHPLAEMFFQCFCPKQIITECSLQTITLLLEELDVIGQHSRNCVLV